MTTEHTALLQALAPVANMTEQEIFDTVARHLLTQKKKSKDVDGMCAYRGSHGLKCAVGALIPDELYDPK